jgi:hypothetical protein
VIHRLNCHDITVSSSSRLRGMPALGGVRNVGLDDPNPGRPDSHCNFGAVGGWQTGALHPASIDLPRPYGGGGPRNRPPAAARRFGQSVEVVVATPPVKVT